MDSFFKVSYTKILQIEDHPSADRLSIATVYGFKVIVPKDKYKINDLIIYIPIDSILSNQVELLLFKADAKIKLTKSRVRQIKIRNFYSQGMIADPEQLSSLLNFKYIKEEQDVSALLGITKYEPPVKSPAMTAGKPNSRKQLAHPDFHSYNGLTNLKWAPHMFDGKNVVIQEKIHGTNARAAKLPFRTNTLMRKIKKLLGLAPAYENLYGSNMVDITNARGYKGYYGEDVYGRCFQEINAHAKLELGEIIYGEIYGPGIQKGYSYGLQKPQFILFDVKEMQDDGKFRWLDPAEVEEFAKERGFDMVPKLYEGPYNLEFTKTLAEGPSVLCPAEKVREGVVVKVAQEYSLEGNKQALKVISEAYLADDTNTDEH